MQGVMNDKHAIAFVGYAYYMANRDKVKAIKVNGVFPTKETIQSGKYKPLSRPLLAYVNNASIRNKMNVANYVEFMIQHVGNLAEEVGYVKLRKEKYNEQSYVNRNKKVMSGWKGFSSLAHNDKSQITFSVQHLIERNTKQRKNALNQSNSAFITKNNC